MDNKRKIKTYTKKKGEIKISLFGDYDFTNHEVLNGLGRQNGSFSYSYSDPIYIECDTYGKNIICKELYGIFNDGASPIIDIFVNEKYHRGDYYDGE